ncbi:MAG: YccF domain-containing protein [Thermoleophilaceae bacterium]
MNGILNIIWLVFAGIWLALAYALAGLVMCITIIGIPIGVAAFRMTNMVLWPFGRTAVKKPGAGAGSGVANVLWFLLCGWWLIIGHLVTAVAMAVTIIGIPLALANVKLIPITLTPFGREIVSNDRIQIVPVTGPPDTRH